jgi:hypothetical protein
VIAHPRTRVARVTVLKRRSGSAAVCCIEKRAWRGIRRVFEEASPGLGWQLQFAEGDTATVLVAQVADADLL